MIWALPVVGSCTWSCQGTSPHCAGCRTHPGAPESLGQTPRPGHTDQSCFLHRSAAPKTAKGLSNPLFHEGHGMPAKGGAPAPPTHPSQPTMPMTRTATPKQPPPAVSTASCHPRAIPCLPTGLRAAPRRQRQALGWPVCQPTGATDRLELALNLRLSASAGSVGRC